MSAFQQQRRANLSVGPRHFGTYFQCSTNTCNRIVKTLGVEICDSKVSMIPRIQGITMHKVLAEFDILIETAKCLH